MSTNSPTPVPLRHFLAAWIPLMLSFELMVMEGPVLQGAIGRLANPELHLAAWGLAMSLAMVIESPVIMLLATSIALVRDTVAYRAMRQFMIVVNATCTVLAAILAFTPLLNVVAEGWMGQPTPMVEASRPALQIMILFTALVGWRRFYQGILIRRGRNQLVTWGTAIRLVALLVASTLLAGSKTLPGIQVAAWALMIALLVECMITTLFAVPVVRNLPQPSPHTPTLTQSEIFRFHTPLAATTLLTLLAQPITSAALAYLPEKEKTLAAWPVVFMILLILRGLGFTLQEVTVAEMKEDLKREIPLFRYTVLVGFWATGLTLLVGLTPLLNFYTDQILQLPPSLRPFIREGVLWGAATPLLSALSAWARGAQVARNSTAVVYQAMMVSLVVQMVILFIGVALKISGMVTATLSFTGAFFAEYLYLHLHRQNTNILAQQESVRPV